MKTSWLHCMWVRFRRSQKDLLTHTKCSSPLVPTHGDGRTVPHVSSATSLLCALPHTVNDASATLLDKTKF